MKIAVMKAIVEPQIGESLSSMLDRVRAGFHGEVADTDWISGIRGELERVDLNQPMLLDAIAENLQSHDKRRRVAKVPGQGPQLALDLCTVDWAQQSIIPLPDNYSITVLEAKFEHGMIGLLERQKKLSELADAVTRWAELLALMKEDGGLGAALKRRGMGGW